MELKNDKKIKEICGLFKILSEPMRLRILNELREHERNVGELVSILGATQANISKHLSLMEKSGIIAFRKEGVKIYYFVTADFIFNLCNLVCNSIFSSDY